jgi:hypothetical protein
MQTLQRNDRVQIGDDFATVVSTWQIDSGRVFVVVDNPEGLPSGHPETIPHIRMVEVSECRKVEE